MAEENPLISTEKYEKKKPSDGPSNRDLKILIVDDLPNMRRTLRNMLRYLGFENVEEVDDGDTGIQKLMEHHFDFVVADWVMPRLSGIEMLRAAKEKPNLKNIPFLMVTAEVDAGQIVQAAETEVDGYIIKPFVAKTLEDKIDSIIHKKKNPSETQKLFLAAEAAKEKQEYGQALAALEMVMVKERSPNSARARQAMGEIYELQGDPDKAEKIYTEAIAVNPQFVKVRQSLGELYEKNGDTEKARRAIEAAAKISPNNPDRLTKLGKLYLESGDIEKADEVFKSAIKHDPNNPERRTAIGEIFMKAGHEDKAAESFQGSLGLKQDTAVSNRLGIALRKKGKFKEAILEYRKAIKVDPGDEALYYNVGRAFMQDKNYASARKAFKKALTIDSDFTDAKKMLEKLEQRGY